MPILYFQFVHDPEENEVAFEDFDEAVKYGESLSDRGDVEYAELLDGDENLLWDHISGVIDQ